MNKNETIEIKALQNGYLVEYSWREQTKEDALDWRYAEEKFLFKTWDEVVEFVRNKQLDVPPAKI